MWTDLRLSLRGLRRTPVFTAVAVLSLALGIGANTAIFSLFDRALLQALPVHDPCSLVLFNAGDLRLRGSSSSDNRETVFSAAMLREFQKRTDLFEHVFARGGLPPVAMQRTGTEFAGVEVVSGNYFDALGLHAALGRTIKPEDDTTSGANPVVLLPHATWMTRFGGDPAVVNSTVRLNGHPFTVVGVLPPRFFSVVHGGAPAVFLPLSMQRQIFPDMDGTRPDVRYINILARLKAGVNRERAEAAIQSTWRAMLDEQLRSSPPADRSEYRDLKLKLNPAPSGINSMKRTLETPLTVLMTTVAFVLSIACVNIASLLLARAAARSRETAIRLSLGANRWHIIRQSLVESVLLSLIGGTLGLLAASWMVNGLLALADVEKGPLLWRIDARLLAFTFAVSILTALLFGAVPALQTFVADLASTLKSQSQSVASSHARIRKALVGTQIALATVLLFAAALFARSLFNLTSIDPGFRVEEVITFTVSPRHAGYDKDRSRQVIADLRAALGRISGVTAAGASSSGPLSGSESSSNITIQGYHPAPNEEAGASHSVVTPDFFRALDIRLLAGRSLTDADAKLAPAVAVVNEAFARRYCDNSAIGRRVGFGRTDKPPMEVVGVVRDVRSSSLKESAKPYIYYPIAQADGLPRINFYLRSARPASVIGDEITATVRALDANLPVEGMQTMRKQVDRAIVGERVMAILSSAFGAVAGLLTAMGIYGVVAWTVARRTGEIAVRMALGAEAGRVVRLVLREVFLIAAAGCAAGAVLAVISARLVESKVFGVSVRDPLVFAAAIACVAVMAISSACVPALRATRIDPAVALRAE